MAPTDVDVAIAGARAGADVVRGLYGRRLTRIDKGAGDFATAADVAAEEAVLDVLRAARPGDAVLGEEGGQQGAGPAEAVRQWLVDPLCGALNYAVGNLLVAVTDGGDLSGSVHFAAGIALCRAAGCVVTGVDGSPVGEGHGLVAAAGEETHGLLMSMIRGS
ncbi:hypothetical protein J7E90_15825 [Streptomyces sp. ISL-111]|uniref:inositol monophosphatase family protein n=1 Tax=Streptomyces sp. ISL-111 TaxID=2819175 RepID=UPI001BE6C29C|nr:inositol monophosphatase family protein [Streptomyces sp. ISL-111]MBT2378775.1 hypothetical protein [Streptomyces sp. ISL-111]